MSVQPPIMSPVLQVLPPGASPNSPISSGSIGPAMASTSPQIGQPTINTSTSSTIPLQELAGSLSIPSNLPAGLSPAAISGPSLESPSINTPSSPLLVTDTPGLKALISDAVSLAVAPLHERITALDQDLHSTKGALASLGKVLHSGQGHGGWFRKWLCETFGDEPEPPLE